ncbi:hypothetical protein NDN08_007094 [Rhodosorus marinus]|uniref:ASPIC/UnbV domain-containing protein n=1 Tax=Rhodosorus marinus TaxID=101924 RepID=A0AAV8UFI9_9RHOD|nr:hypothetical protein NDN08_007094 [Rhodosorus marinus]
MEGVAGLWFDVADLDNDGRLDLVFMKYTGVEVWKNMGNYKFKPSTILPRQERIKNVRAMVQFDYDNDGDLDLYFVRGSSGRSIPNTFYENVNGKYVDRTSAAGLVLGGYNVHVTAGDFNNDGCVDLYVTVNTGLEGRQDDKLMLNNCDKTFSEVPAGRTGMKSRNKNEDGDNVHAVDVQMDGKLDIISGSMNSTWRYYKNTTPTDNNHWIIVRVGAPRPSRWNASWLRSEMGALVRVFCGDQIFTQRVNSPGRSHSASHYNMLHFGLGKCTKVKKITVHYVNGIKAATASTLVDRIKNVGLFFRCPKGFEGAQCKKRVPGCSANPCPRMGLCEIYTRGNSRRFCKLPA